MADIQIARLYTATVTMIPILVESLTLESPTAWSWSTASSASRDLRTVSPSAHPFPYRPRLLGMSYVCVSGQATET